MTKDEFEVVNETEEETVKPSEAVQEAVETPVEQEEPAAEAEETAVPAEVPAEENEAAAEKPVDDVPPEAAVPADAGEDIREDIKQEIPAPRREEKPAVAAVSRFGVESEEIERANVLKQMDNDRKSLLWRRLSNYVRNKTVLWGMVTGITNPDNLDTYAVVVDFNGVQVQIPDKEYFMSTYQFGPAYDGLESEKAKSEYRSRIAGTQLNAQIPFILMGIDHASADKPDVIIGAGSRVEGMTALQEHYFLHDPNDKHNPELGTEVPVHILSVNPRYILAEACGVETRIDSFNAGAGYESDCTRIFLEGYTKPAAAGQSATGRIRKLHYRDNDVYLTVSFRLYNEDNTENVKRGDMLAGVVDHHNRDKGTYTIYTKHGVSVNVAESNVQGRLELSPGDKVQVIVTRVLPDFVFGIARKIQ